MEPSRLPITVIYGLPSAGKSTIAAYVGGRCPGERIGVGRLDSNAQSLESVRELAQLDNLDYLLLEASGPDDPALLAARLTPGSRSGAALAEVVRLDTMVAVVDACSVLRDFCSWDLVGDRGLATHPTDDRALVEVLAEQIEFADVVVLTKVDLVSDVTRRNVAVLVSAEPRCDRHRKRVRMRAAAQGTPDTWIRACARAGQVALDADSHGLARGPFGHVRNLGFPL